ncbi:MAG: DNA primase [Buchnera aphidicola (Pentalonia nigronervosa)]|uniref:DNA primase n=1 Tax=Buchnera aphidicola (Pentalonia nigronervosa) TaxID=1309793 RepID=A0A7H1AZ99_9GAMM|nr:MAG: DNA primase [Buchnera aphidicola (Pentalonia nigronervosa)]
MTGTIPKYFINELLFRTNIIELINTRIKLKKNGKNYQTNCPFHYDKTPSFTVNYEKQFYYCFGCRNYGNAIDFLMHYEHLTFVESIEELSILHGMQIPFHNSQKNHNNDYIKKQKMYFLTNKIAFLYHKNIHCTHIAHQYLSKRGINKKMIQMFLIGYSDVEWQIFSSKINITTNLEKQLLDQKIININKMGKRYDCFQGRIIFPIQDKHGRILGFGGRSINNTFPKYLNSPETNIFHKGKQIYGLYQVKKKHPKPAYLLVVEGYIDVIILTQYNIDYVVSLLGTAITKEQTRLLFQNSSTIIYCYDGDTAGRNASWHALKNSLPYISDEKILKFVFLPKNEDPDSIIQKEGKEKFQKRIENAMTMTEFFFKYISKNINLSSNDDKFHLSAQALPLINSIPSDTIQLYLRQVLARKIGILDDDQLEKFLYYKKNETKKIQQFQIKRTSMRILIGLLVQNPHLSKITPELKQFENAKIKGLSIFLEILNTCTKYPNINTGQLLELYRDKKIIHILKILSRWDHMIVQKEISNVFLDSLTNIYNKILEKRQEYLISKERLIGLKKCEKQEIWNINKKLSKKCKLF